MIIKSWLEYKLTDDVLYFKCQIDVGTEHALKILKKEIWRKNAIKRFCDKNFGPELNLHI